MYQQKHPDKRIAKSVENNKINKFKNQNVLRSDTLKTKVSAIEKIEIVKPMYIVALIFHGKASLEQ